MYQENKRKRFRSPEERVGTLSLAALPPPTAPVVDLEEHLWVQALRQRDESAFERLVERHYSAMFRLAIGYVRSREEAEEVVQETWLGVLAGVERFEGRSSLRTWIFRILVNRARSRARREARTTPLSALRVPAAAGSAEPGDGDADAVLDRLYRTRPATAAWGVGAAPPGPEDRLLATELRERIDAAIRALPQRQRNVITLRDVEGWPAAEVSELLSLSEANQRVLLHRARLRVREALLPYLAEAGEPTVTDDPRTSPPRPGDEPRAVEPPESTRP